MATKDRIALKDEFKNGNLATGERFTDLIDSMKVVQEPVTDPAASGTSLSFIDSISQDADGKITPTKKTLDLANAHELNPFKGWYKTGDTLPTTGFDGAYLYFKDTSELTGQTTIYRWNGTAYADTGTVVDTSNVQTFETGQALNGVAIDGTGLENPDANALAKAIDVMDIAVKVHGITKEVHKVDNGSLVVYDPLPNDQFDSGFWYNNQGTATAIYFPTNSNESTKIDISGYDSVRFLGIVRKKITVGVIQYMPTYCFLDEDSVPIVSSITPYEELPADETTAYQKEYTAVVPSGAKYFVVCWKQSNTTLTQSDFYCYLYKGDDIVTTVKKSADVFPQSDSADLVTSGAVVDLLSAKYEEMTSSDYTTAVCALGVNGYFGSNISTLHAVIPCVAGDKYYIVYEGSFEARLAFATSSESDPNTQIPLVSGTSVMVFSKKVFVVPEGTSYLLLQGYAGSRIYSISEGELSVEGGQESKSRTIYPIFRYGTLRMSNGEYDDNPNYANRSMVATPRYIKTTTDFKLTSSITSYMQVMCYDKDFIYLGVAENKTYLVASDTTLDIHVLSRTEYVKIVFLHTDNTAVDIPVVSLEGNFGDNWDIFNIRPSDSGYHRVQVVVNVTNPTCCDEVTSTVQDEPDYKVDYGVICLPETYTNNGPATRLIIYCHGAAVNYSENVRRFDPQDLEPEYWLAEGYAVLDVEGNPFNNEDEHIQTPQALDCYVAGYKWAIEHYNLRRDGVFLGGRSMGGQNTFNLMRRECPIPVIAACPNSPASDASFGYGVARRKAFCAEHMGFDVPSGFVWSDGLVTSAEIQVIYDNWDKYIKCCPELSACVDLPSKDVVLSSANYPRDKTPTLWSTLHMVAKCPVKLFGCIQDTSCPPSVTTALFYRMLINSGQIAECRLFNSYKDYSGTGTTAHHYDTQDPALRATVTTKYGETMTDVPIVYIEMLQFWRRFEQEN